MLTQKRINVLNDIYAGVNPSEAYFNHYSVKSLAVASAAVNQLLKNIKCQDYLNKLREEERERLIKHAVMSKEEAAQTASEIARARLGQLIDGEGNITPDKDDLMSPAVSEYKVTQGTTKAGVPWESRTVKIRDPLSAMEFLAKLYGWNEEKNGTFIDMRDAKILVQYEEPKLLKDGN